MNKVLFSSNRMDWETQEDLFDKLDRESQRIEQIERKLPDILEEIRKNFGGKSENKDD